MSVWLVTDTSKYISTDFGVDPALLLSLSPLVVGCDIFRGVLDMQRQQGSCGGLNGAPNLGHAASSADSFHNHHQPMRQMRSLASGTASQLWYSDILDRLNNTTWYYILYGGILIR
jgi:hypothetical protein